MINKSILNIKGWSIITVFFCLMMVPLCAHSKNVLTEIRINLFLKSLQSANQQQNIDRVVSHFADHARIKLERPPILGDKKLNLDLSEFKKLLENEMSPNQKREYRVEKVRIKLNKAGDIAKVKDKTTETAKLAGQSIKIKSKQQIQIELVDGKPLITQFTSKVVDVDLPEKLKMLLSVLNPAETKIEYSPSDIERKYSGVQAVSKTAKDQFGNGDSFEPSISTDGRYIAFSSTANNLAENDANTESDIYLYDRETRSIKLISKNLQNKAANGASINPAISGNGLFLTFTSFASDLIKKDQNNQSDVFLYELNTEKITRISETKHGRGGDNFSGEPSISFDGQLVVFTSRADNLLPEDKNEVNDIFIYRLVDKSLQRISVSSDGYESDDHSSKPKISADGKVIAYQSEAENLIENDNNELSDIYYYEIDTKQTIRISLTSKQKELQGSSINPVISETGEYVLFESNAENLITDNKKQKNKIFLRDMNTKKTMLVKNNNAVAPKAISADGRYVIYSIWGNDKFNPRTSVVLHDLEQDKHTVISKRYKRDDNTKFSYAMSSDGRYISYVTDSSMAKAKDQYKDIQLFLTLSPFIP